MGCCRRDPLTSVALIDKYSLLLFDLDGTLADTHQLIFDSFNHILRKYKSIEMTPKEILSYFGPPEEVCIKNMLNPDDFDMVWSDFLGYYSSHLKESKVFEGVQELLKNVKSRRKLMGVFTAKGTRTAELTLGYHGIENFFDIVVTGSSVKNHKPDPEGIVIALTKLGVPAAKTIVIGDSPSDYKASVAAGSDFIAVTYDSISRNRFDGIECVKASSVRDLASLLLGEGNIN